MRLTVFQTEKRFVEVLNETVGGIIFNIDTNHDLSNTITALANDDVSVYTTLDGKKEKEIVPKMSLLELHAKIFAGNKPLSLKTFQTSKGIGGGTVYQLPFSFETPLNLKNGEGLFIEVSNKLLSAGTNTTITVETIPTIGVNQFFPKLEVLELEATKSYHDLHLGNDVAKVIYLGNGTAIAPYDVDEVNVTSDKLDTVLTSTLVYSQLLDTVEPDVAYAGTPIYLLDSKVHTLNDLRLKLKFTNAIAGRKLIIFRKIITPQILTNLITKTQEHQSENIQAIKAGGSH